MRTDDFDYRLPASAIAQHPAERGNSRLLDLRREGSDRHRRIADLPDLLEPGDLMVVNDSRVIPARLHARRATGGAVEVLLLEPESPNEWWALLRPGRKCPVGTTLTFAPEVSAEVTDRREEQFLLRFSEPLAPHLERLGEVPLPPYIRRPPEEGDRERYQTVYARRAGSVAAPTAGLHFDDQLLEQLAQRGIRKVTLTLHVGPDTFRPVEVSDPSRHRLAGERYVLGAETVEAIVSTRARGGRILAVGTTVVRTLEASAVQTGVVRAGAGTTSLFILPGFRFRVVDLLLTNFHLPRSTLLMLVAAFAGRSRVLRAYEEAIAEGYRFYSYGDAMLAAKKTS